MKKRYKNRIPSTGDYQAMLHSPLFLDMESFSNSFLKNNEASLQSYFEKWVSDPLHQWSRQWEYPYVFQKIEEYVKKTKNDKPVILDAGSGVTFFPYFLLEKYSNSTVLCADLDETYTEIYNEINKGQREKVSFSVANLQDLDYGDNSIDIIYCISVLEHTKNYDAIMDEFRRVLTPGGFLIVTFDISIDGKNDISIDGAENLITLLEDKFKVLSHPESIREAVSSKDILTTTYAYSLDPKLIWRSPPSSLEAISKNFKSIM